MKENHGYPEEKAKELAKKIFSPIHQETLEDGRIKVDFETDFEDFLSITVLLGLIINLIFLLMLIFDDISMDEYCVDKEYYLIPLLVSIIAGIYRFSMNHYYILDPYKQEILFAREVFNFKNESFIAPFSDIYCIALQGKRERSKYSKWWEYFGAMILRNGKVIRISNAYKIEEGNYISDFRELAKKLNVPFLQVKENHLFKVKNRPIQSDQDIETITEKEADRNYLIKILIWIILVFISILFLAAYL